MDKVRPETLDRIAKPQSLAQVESPENTKLGSTQSLLALEKALARFWTKMGEIHGAKWSNQFGTSEEPAFGTWLSLLKDLTPAHIKSGFETMLRQSPDYMPDAAEFRRYCMGLVGIPDVQLAYVEACTATKPKKNYAWSHPIVFHAGEACGWGYLEGNVEAVAFPKFKAVYALLVKRLERGDILDAPVPLMLTHNKRRYSWDEQEPGFNRFRDSMRKLGL